MHFLEKDLEKGLIEISLISIYFDGIPSQSDGGSGSQNSRFAVCIEVHYFWAAHEYRQHTPYLFLVP